MAWYVLRRLAQAVAVLWGVTIAAFVLLHVIANGPGLARLIIGSRAGPAQVRFVESEYGLNAPIPVQYGRYLGSLLHGDLGYSYKLNESVRVLIGHDLPRDLVLVAPALVIALLLAVPAGLLQAQHRNRSFDYVATGVSFGLYSMPYFLLGLLLIAAFAVSLHLFPAEAPQGVTIAGVVGDPRALVLPVGTLALGMYALFSRYMRSSAVEALTQDYVRTARSKGAGPRRVMVRHVLRNAMLPIVTLVGLSVPGLITAAFIVEYVFNFPGTGLLFYNAAVGSDYPLELGITIVAAAATVIGSLLADLAAALLDPRIVLR